ncbi:hypothetical protein [Mycolicibacterium sp. YH-1]|uniref:hypothetical protein n=1 Tax=Mycolicibacterium sp. YH-1 TaxID=2908837 RepID=UPI001F4C480C|nr:hypothetical protein [Mycolicibacterium sp. YH-1]UNB54436.1 hypothetical protein L0M16_08990 [Mycolicibacterium sp. YH-1]
MLSARGAKIAPSTHYDACVRPQRPSKRQVRDEELEVEISRMHHENNAAYGHAECGCNASVRASRLPAAPSDG